jgi:glyoxylase-like metal-dependent hydrolase (beta-lactamase superfamily II)
VQVAPDVFRYADSANSYLIRVGGESRDAILVDIGTGDVLDHLADFGVDRVTDVLMTHHHRDGAQGLARAAEQGIRIWVPSTERDLFERVDEHWQMRPLDNVYDLRQDRFSILHSVPIAGVVPDYRTRSFGGVDVLTLPTPGHTPGSVSYILERDGRRIVFSGDLIAAPGKVWSLAATQWTYTGIEGVGSTILSALDLRDREPDVLLPAHGEPIDDPKAAMDLVTARLQELVNLRSPEWKLAALRERPYLEISRHLLLNRTAVANSYVLLSDSGGALVIDFGYDFTTGLPSGFDRSSRKPWLATLPALKRHHGVDRVEVAVPTHYHDDHVAGFNLLREVEGTEVWSPANMTALFREPRRFDLPCLWYDPIGVDREVGFGRPVKWHEYELTFHELPGHTLYAVAIEMEVDGRRVLATGDQQNGMWVPGEREEILNYQYRNGFRIDDFERSAALYRRLQPDLMISGHWQPRPVTDEYLAMLTEKGASVARLHRELLPLETVDFGAGGFGAAIEPYQSTVARGDLLALDVLVRNPFDRPNEACVTLALPPGWTAEPLEGRITLGPKADGRLAFIVQTPSAGGPVRRARIGADLTVGDRRFGEQAEALVTLV